MARNASARVLGLGAAPRRRGLESGVRAWLRPRGGGAGLPFVWWGSPRRRRRGIVSFCCGAAVYEGHTRAQPFYGAAVYEARGARARPFCGAAVYEGARAANAKKEPCCMPTKGWAEGHVGCRIPPTILANGATRSVHASIKPVHGSWFGAHTTHSTTHERPVVARACESIGFRDCEVLVKHSLCRRTRVRRFQT